MNELTEIEVLRELAGYYKMTVHDARELIKEVKEENCHPTSRLMQDHEKHLVEFTASLNVAKPDTNESRAVLVAYYYQPVDDVDSTEDLSDLLWEVDHYTLW